MILGLSFYIFLLICLGMFWIGNAHVLPKGFHLSNSCQPRCQSGKTCVVYRGNDGNAHVTCKRIDPHKVVLDGTFIVSAPALNRPSNDLTLVSQNTAYEKNIVDFGSLIKPLPDIGVETATAKDAIISNPEGLLNSITTFADSIRQDFKNELGSIDNRPQLFNPATFAKNVNDFPLFKNLPSPEHNKGNERKRSKFEGLTLVRNADGGVVFRRIGASPHHQSSSQGLNVEIISIENRNVSDSSNFEKGHTSQEPIPPQTLEKKKSAEHMNATCTPCDPDQSCPERQYCFYSPSCARQICQPLN